MNSKRTSVKLARQLGAVRHKKIESIRNKILAGRYKVDNAVLAKALFLAR